REPLGVAAEGEAAARSARRGDDAGARQRMQDAHQMMLRHAVGLGQLLGADLRLRPRRELDGGPDRVARRLLQLHGPAFGSIFISSSTNGPAVMPWLRRNDISR